MTMTINSLKCRIGISSCAMWKHSRRFFAHHPYCIWLIWKLWFFFSEDNGNGNEGRNRQFNTFRANMCQFYISILAYVMTQLNFEPDHQSARNVAIHNIFRNFINLRSRHWTISLGCNFDIFRIERRSFDFQGHPAGTLRELSIATLTSTISLPFMSPSPLSFTKQWTKKIKIKQICEELHWCYFNANRYYLDNPSPGQRSGRDELSAGRRSASDHHCRRTRPRLRLTAYARKPWRCNPHVQPTCVSGQCCEARPSSLVHIPTRNSEPKCKTNQKSNMTLEEG